MEKLKSHLKDHYSAYMWAGLAAYVIGVDALSPKDQTLSSGVDRALEHPIGKYPAIIAVGLIGSHLLNLNEHFGIPDPVKSLADGVSKLRR